MFKRLGDRRTYLFVHGIGNIRVDKVYKVKNGKVTLKTKTYEPNGENETKTIKSKKEMIRIRLCKLYD
ncbi:MAG: hypothetical protein IK014_02955 [Lachnospiraceae bacterium]|nr:hypothetical protein [Lachnospiraceae bacterium]